MPRVVQSELRLVDVGRRGPSADLMTKLAVGAVVDDDQLELRKCLVFETVQAGSKDAGSTVRGDDQAQADQGALQA
jgi:hypothetical protein